MRATKSVLQPCADERLHALLDQCLTLTYNAIYWGQENGVTNRKGMKEFYGSLKGVNLPSCYKLASITRACAVLKSRGKSERRGMKVSHSKPLRLMVCIISGFFITAKGRLFIPLQRDRYFDIQLNQHVMRTLEGVKVTSLTITPDLLSFCYSEEVEPAPVRTVFGVDRNEKNLTFGNADGVVKVELSETVRIRQTTRKILGSFKRNDVRVRRKLAHKYWRRASHRTNQMFHAATNFVVEAAARNSAALALESLTDIRKMYRRGGGHDSDYRFRLNSWPYWKAQQMLEYKSVWKGVTAIQLTKSETYSSSSVHWVCGERLHSPERDDAVHRRMLWCQACKVWVERDMNAAVVLSQRGLARFASSLPRSEGSPQTNETREKGLAGEAMRGNPTKTVILRVDASKLARRPMVNAAVGYLGVNRTG